MPNVRLMFLWDIPDPDMLLRLKRHKSCSLKCTQTNKAPRLMIHVITGGEFLERIGQSEFFTNTQLGNYLCLSKSDNSRKEMARLVDLVPKGGQPQAAPVTSALSQLTKECDDDIQIRADRQELQQFHHLVIRPVTPIFNPLGQYCQVRRCCSLSKYSTLRELHTHWQYLHQPNRQIYKCGKCQKMFWIKSRCFRHISFKHYVIKDNIHKFFNTIVPPNVYYIENRGTMLPRLGTAVENSEFINRGKSEASSSSSNRAFGGCRDYGERLLMINHFFE
ncbi:unnamed protein product [Mytilus edulis]|uniref:C2H2-type domain-containing protein n=1 Tax=Mytilus edulis TaxID=6550 RepID=A0A8S3S3V0_MYTED|nr:unnamed protein product [Mytilus edulis]